MATSSRLDTSLFADFLTPTPNSDGQDEHHTFTQQDVDQAHKKGHCEGYAKGLADGNRHAMQSSEIKENQKRATALQAISQAMADNYAPLARKLTDLQSETNDAIIPIVETLVEDLSAQILSTKISSAVTSIIMGTSRTHTDELDPLTLTVIINASDHALIVDDINAITTNFSETVLVSVKVGDLPDNSCRIEWSGGALWLDINNTIKTIKTTIEAYKLERTRAPKEINNG